MRAITVASSKPIWRLKKTYICMLAVFGLLHGFLFVYGFSHPPSQAGIQLFVGFTLNVALLSWCYIDAEERMIAISGLLGFLLLFIAWIGVPWYFIRSRSFIGALKAGLGFGLFAIWFAALMIAAVISAIVEAIVSRL